VIYRVILQPRAARDLQEAAHWIHEQLKSSAIALRWVRCPRASLLKTGPRPEFAELYGALEMPTDSYCLRTEQNVRDSQATLWFGSTDTPGAKTTLNACQGMGRPLLIVPQRQIRSSAAAVWVRSQPPITLLNIAGNRESTANGIGDRVEQFPPSYSASSGTGQGDTITSSPPLTLRFRYPPFAKRPQGRPQGHARHGVRGQDNCCAIGDS
jgi:hypothetical protein